MCCGECLKQFEKFYHNKLTAKDKKDCEEAIENFKKSKKAHGFYIACKKHIELFQAKMAFSDLSGFGDEK